LFKTRFRPDLRTHRPTSSNRIVDKWKSLSERYVNPSEIISYTVPLASPDVGGFDEYCEYVNDVRILKTTCSAVYNSRYVHGVTHVARKKHFISSATVHEKYASETLCDGSQQRQIRPAKYVLPK